MNKKQVLVGSILILAIIGAIASFTWTSKPTPTSTSPAPLFHLPLKNIYGINRPNTLILVDSEGRRTGKDPATGTLYREIPGAHYGGEGGSGELYFSEPPAGQYTLYVLGGQTGQYHLDSWVDDGGPNPPVAQRISGDIHAGSMIAYRQNYNPANIPSSTFSFLSTASSTASITSAPSNNLPPPPIPGQK